MTRQKRKMVVSEAGGTPCIWGIGSWAKQKREGDESLGPSQRGSEWTVGTWGVGHWDTDYWLGWQCPGSYRYLIVHVVNTLPVLRPLWLASSLASSTRPAHTIDLASLLDARYAVSDLEGPGEGERPRGLGPGCPVYHIVTVPSLLTVTRPKPPAHLGADLAWWHNGAPWISTGCGPGPPRLDCRDGHWLLEEEAHLLGVGVTPVCWGAGVWGRWMLRVMMIVSTPCCTLRRLLPHVKWPLRWSR